jgi:hypothetical protein
MYRGRACSPLPNEETTGTISLVVSRKSTQGQSGIRLMQEAAPCEQDAARNAMYDQGRR